MFCLVASTKVLNTCVKNNIKPYTTASASSPWSMCWDPVACWQEFQTPLEHITFLSPKPFPGEQSLLLPKGVPLSASPKLHVPSSYISANFLSHLPLFREGFNLFPLFLTIFNTPFNDKGKFLKILACHTSLPTHQQTNTAQEMPAWKATCTALPHF